MHDVLPPAPLGAAARLQHQLGCSRSSGLARCRALAWLVFGGAGALGCSLRSLDELEGSPVGSASSGLAECGERAARGESELSCTDGGASCPACPPEMQEVQFADGTAFCIDRYETTRGAYDEFLADVERCGAPSEGLCKDDAVFVPGSGEQCSQTYVPGVSANLPITCVDLCDAKAYCEWRGKRLCGAKGGGLASGTAVDDPTRDEWFAACTGGTERSYPYADEYSPSVCNTDAPEVRDGRSFDACVTPDQIFNLSGNVAEWELACGSKQQYCHVRGGAFSSRDAALSTCAAGKPSNTNNLPIFTRKPELGIRCCQDSAG